MDELRLILPVINWMRLPKREQDAARLLNTNLALLLNEVSKFSVALDLADYCDRQRSSARVILAQTIIVEAISERKQAAIANRTFIEWKRLAVRDATMTVANFHEVKQAIHGLVGQCPTIRDLINREALAEGGKIFDAAFPSFADIRFSVAHSGKPFVSPDKLNSHRLPTTNTMVVQMLEDRRLSSFVKGKEVSLSLSRESLDSLRASATAMMKGFELAAQLIENPTEQ